MLTPHETSLLLEIPPSSLRRYVKLFYDYFSPDAQKPRGRRYNDDDIATLALIRRLTHEDGVKLKDVSEHLDTLVHDHERKEATALTIPAILNKFKAFEEETHSLRETAQTLQDETIELRSEVGDLRAALEDMQAERSLNVWQRLRRSILPNSQK